MTNRNQICLIGLAHDELASSIFFLFPLLGSPAEVGQDGARTCRSGIAGQKMGR